MTVLRLSNSEMKQWRQDRRHWYLSTYLAYGKPDEGEEPGSALLLGNLYHDALAVYYEDGSDPVKFIEEDTLARLGPAENPSAFSAQIEKDGALVHAMVSGYMEWLEETGADIDYEVLGSERMVQVPLTPEIHLISKLDAPVVRKSDGARLALEHKTVGTLEANMPLLKVDTQLLTEHLAQFLAARCTGLSNEDAYETCHGVLYNQARKVKRTAAAKPPFYARETIPHNIHELRNHWRHCVAVGTEILAARAALDAGADHHNVCPPNPTRDSSWMNPFLKIYTMMDDGSDWESALRDLYTKRDPLARYDGAEQLVG